MEAPVRTRFVIDERAAPPDRITPGRLDLDHVGAEVGEQLAAGLAPFARQIEHPVRVQQPRLVVHGSSPATNLTSARLANQR